MEEKNNAINQGIGDVSRFANQLRSDELLQNLIQQDINLERALSELQSVRDFCSSPEHILGSMATKHGEIAEHVQVGFVNADDLIIGQEATYTFNNVSRTAPEDYLRNKIPIQSKFVQKSFSLDAVNEHLNKYPDFISNGGMYEIPCDYYDKIQRWRNLSPKEISNLPSSEDGNIARNIIKKIKNFEQTHNVRFEDVVKPTQVKYADVQLGKVGDTIDNKELEIIDIDGDERQKYEIKAQPSFKEGLKVSGIAAIIDGVFSFGTTIIGKFKQGKKLSDFTQDDWRDILKETGVGVVRGGVTGGSIYALTNIVGTSAPLAASIVSATFGVVKQAIQLGKGVISIDDFLYNLEQVAVDTVVSGVGAFVGQLLIPIPVVGAIVGSLVGATILSTIRDNLFGGNYYNLLNNAKYEASMSSTYRIIASSLEKSKHTFENLIRTYINTTSDYQTIQEEDKKNEDKLNNLIESI